MKWKGIQRFEAGSDCCRIFPEDHTVVSSKNESREDYLEALEGFWVKRGACTISVQDETERSECCKIYFAGRTNRT